MGGLATVAGGRAGAACGAAQVQQDSRGKGRGVTCGIAGRIEGVRSMPHKWARVTGNSWGSLVLCYAFPALFPTGPFPVSQGSSQVSLFSSSPFPRGTREDGEDGCMYQACTGNEAGGGHGKVQKAEGQHIYTSWIPCSGTGFAPARGTVGAGGTNGHAHCWGAPLAWAAC
jgi:hypothetical protein